MKSTQLKSSLILSLPGIILTGIAIYLTVIKPLFMPYIVGLDGLDYAALAIHLIHGIGSWWTPQFSATHFTHFYEHPPVGIWYFALFYKIFGDSWHTDKIISFTNALWMLIIIMAFFRRDFPKATRWLVWLPLCLFLLNPYIHFYVDTNKFECVELPYALTLLYWLTQCRYQFKSNRYLILQSIIAGVFCVIGFEINGLLCLYVWIAYLAVAATSDYLTWRKACWLTLLFVGATLLWYGSLMWLIPAARHNNWMYFSTQLFPSILSQRTDTIVTLSGIKRIMMLGNYIRYILPWFLISIGCWLLLTLTLTKCKAHQQIAYQHNNKRLLFYIIFITATTFPLLASGKVLSYYNLQTNAFITLFLCCLLTPLLQYLYQQKTWLMIQYVYWWVLSIMIGGFLLIGLSITRYPRQYDLAYMAYKSALVMHRYIPNNSIVSIPPMLMSHSITLLEPMLLRFYNISLIGGQGCQYYIQSVYSLIQPSASYHKIDIPLVLLSLYKRPHPLPSCKPQGESLQKDYTFGAPVIFLI